MGNFTVQDAEEAITKMYKDVGADRASLLERMLRAETAHFTSTQYKATGTAGMEAGAWGSHLAAFLPTYTTVPFQDKQDKTRGVRDFIVWPNVYLFLKFLNYYIDHFNGDFAHWNSTNPTAKANYAKLVNSVTPFTVNKLKNKK